MKNNKNLKTYFYNLIQLAWTFFKIGAITFGGGYAMISVMERNVAEKKKWITHEEMLNIVAIAESTPGAIALNAATFIGAKIAGFFGALVASLASMLPSVIIIVGISLLYNHFADSQYLYWAGLGMRGAVAALILNAVLNLGKFLKTERRPAIWAILILSLTLSLLASFEVIHFDNIFIILGSMVIGFIYTAIDIAIKKKKESNKAIDSIDNTEYNTANRPTKVLTDQELERNCNILSHEENLASSIEQDINVENLQKKNSESEQSFDNKDGGNK